MTDMCVMTFALCRTWSFSGTFPTKAWVERIVIVGYPMEPYRIMLSLGMWALQLYIIHTSTHVRIYVYLLEVARQQVCMSVICK